MVYHKLKPVYLDGQLRYGICPIAISAYKKHEKLRIYHKSHSGYQECISNIPTWRNKDAIKLSYRERSIIQEVQAGKTNPEIAKKIFRSIQTVKSGKKAILEKLEVKNIEQAITYAINHDILSPLFREPKDAEKKEPEKKEKRKHVLTIEILERIQKGLSNGQSVNSLANKERFSEKTLRNAIKQGKLKKNSEKSNDSSD
jgi:DNA-binding CsgD family transcriptional regulator